MPNARLRRRTGADRPRMAALRVLRAVTGDGAYANLELGRVLAEERFDPRDAAFVTELVFGTCRLQGTYDLVIARASGRDVGRLQPALLDVLRLGAHQLLSMRVPTHAAVGAGVEMAAATVGEKVAGLTNAVLRRVAARDLDGWVAELLQGQDEVGALAIRTHHPRWIAAAYLDVLGEEAGQALAANNVSPVPTLVVRPGLATLDELDGEPTRWSPWGARRPGNPGDVPAVRDGRAGVQDEGSQLVAGWLADAPGAGPWLDLCAGPGGKAALLAGLAAGRGERLVAAELAEHRAVLVRQALRAYGEGLANGGKWVGPGGTGPLTICADGTRPAWPAGRFGHVMADVPCTGLGALRRRPESRWRRTPADLADLVPLQEKLLASAIDAATPGGTVAYVTCSPHPAETVSVVDRVLRGHPRAVELIPPGRPGADEASGLKEGTPLPEGGVTPDGRFRQLWPHRHGTDAMFCALLSVGSR